MADKRETDGIRALFEKVLKEIELQGADKHTSTQMAVDAAKQKADEDLLDVKASQAKTDAKLLKAESTIKGVRRTLRSVQWVTPLLATTILIAISIVAGVAYYVAQQNETLREQVYQLRVNDALQDKEIQRL